MNAILHLSKMAGTPKLSESQDIWRKKEKLEPQCKKRKPNTELYREAKLHLIRNQTRRADFSARK